MPTDLPENWMPEEERKRCSSLMASSRAVGSAVNWLYWVAGITVVNALLPLFGHKAGLSLGLGITRVAEGIFIWMGITHPAFTVIAAVLSAAFIVALGYMGKRNPWALGVAVALLALDTTLFFVVGGFSKIGIFFRLWVIGALINGLMSLQRLKAAATPS